MSSENFSAPYKKGDFIGQKYQVYDVLGMGGFGIVYLVYSHKTGSVHALKTFREEYIQDKEAQERFKKEAKIWIDLERHPYLVRAYFVDEILHRFFIALEYIAPNEDGLNSLEGYLRYKLPDLSQSLRWAIQFCYGMEYAYSKGIRAHRDIKPANILIGQDKAVKITDFGIAGIIGNARISGIKMDIRNNTVGFSCQTAEGRGFGTPTHMPPEQFTNAFLCDERSDIYSFGIVIYQMAAGGSLPFLPRLPVNNSPEEQSRFWWDIYKLHCNASVPRMNSPLFPIIQICLEKEPTKRYQSFAELRSELEPILKKLTGKVIKIPEQKELEDWESYIKGISLDMLGKHQEAIACFDRAIEINPRNADVWINKGAALYKLGKYQEAIVCSDKAIKVNPRYARAWNNKGFILNNLGSYQEAIACYDKAIEIEPRDATTWGLKGVSLSDLGKYYEAIGCYDRAIEIEPRDAETWYQKGYVLNNHLGRHQEAIACYDRAIEIEPRDTKAWLGKGAALYNLGKYREAIVAYENFIKVAPPHYADKVAEVKAFIQKLSNLTLNVEKVRSTIGADIEAKRRSFEQFIQMDKKPDDRKDIGLQSVFKSIFPIKDDSGTATLDFVYYTLEKPEYGVEECQQRGMAYLSSMKIIVRLVMWDKDGKIRDVKEQEMYFGVIPLMTENGTFIINGTERVFVSQFYPFAVDDIDYQTTGKSVCEVLENLYRIGLLRMVRTVKEKMNSCDIDTVLPYELMNPKEVMEVWRVFFALLLPKIQTK